MREKWKCPYCGTEDKLNEEQKESGIALCLCPKCHCNYIIHEGKYKIEIREKRNE